MSILDSWITDLPQQFQEKKNIGVLIEAFAKQLEELNTAFEEIQSKTVIDNAEGDTLDKIGSIVSLSRRDAGILAGKNVGEWVMSDERYRQYLKYKILSNTNECSYYDLMEGLRLLWNVSPIYYSEDSSLPATIILTMPFLKPGGDPVLLGEVPMVKSAGVAIDFMYQIKAIVETYSKLVEVSYTVPICGKLVCGTYPRPGSIGEILGTITDAEAIINGVVYDPEKVCGTWPRPGSIGELIDIIASAEVSQIGEVFTLETSGTIDSGTKPTESMVGASQSSEANAYASVVSGTTSPNIAGRTITGAKHC